MDFKLGFLLIGIIFKCKCEQFDQDMFNYRKNEVIQVAAVQEDNEKLKIGILGAPFGQGQQVYGVTEGPDFCRETGFIQLLQKQNVQIKDYGNILFATNSAQISSSQCAKKCYAKNVDQVGNATKLIFKQVKKIIRNGEICLTLGGDHSISIGTIAATSQKYNGDLAVLWIDAHGDINTPCTSLCGNFHGMPLGFLVKELESNVTKFSAFSWLKPNIWARNLVYIGTRNLDPPEKVIIKKLNITAFTMEDIRKLGIRKVTQMALDKVSPGGKRPLHVSFDVDALDPTEIAITGTPVPGGLTLNEGILLMKEIFIAGNMIAMDVTEVNPALGNTKEKAKASKAIQTLILSAFGY